MTKQPTLTRRCRARLITAGIAAMGLAACGAAPDDLARPDEGPSIGPSIGPSVVSLNPCLDAILAEVAAPEQILALSHFSRDPASSSMDVDLAAKFGVTGGTAEEVIALNPDIVLASSFIAPATQAALDRAGVQVETFGSPASVAESLVQVRSLSELIGRKDAGEALIAALSSQPVQPSSKQTYTALLWQPGQIVAGETSLVAEHLRWAGFANQSVERGLGQADFVSLESVLANPPQVLLVAGDAPGQQHPVMTSNATPMVVVRFEPSLFYCAGPSFPRARQRLLEIRTEVEAQR